MNERLRVFNIVFVGRPVFARADKEAGVFRFLDDQNTAVRTVVRFGRVSVSTIEVVNGLNPGDRVILSDTSEWDRYDAIQVE